MKGMIGYMLDKMMPIERMVNQILWASIMYAPYQGAYEFENNTFIIHPYSWNEDSDNDWNFYHKPSGFKLRWYKYPLRSPEANMGITHEQFYAILQDCMNSTKERVELKIIDCTFEKWWEK